MNKEEIFTMILATVLFIFTLISVWGIERDIKLIEKRKRVRLLRLILSEFVNCNSFFGICEVMAHKLPNKQDHKFIKDYIVGQKYKKGELFFDKQLNRYCGYWWPLTAEGKETRIKFLNYLISKNL